MTLVSNNMIYLGNFVEWLNPLWLDYVLANRGIGRPKEGKTPDSDVEESEYQKARDAGYSPDEIYFYMFDKNNTPFEIPRPKFIPDTSNFHWWITKMNPGNFMPMHIDPHTTYQKNSRRYWIPLQDWEPGHIFVYEDTMPSKYHAGDVYMYNDSAALHGAANIGHTPRVVLQISEFQ